LPYRRLLRLARYVHRENYFLVAILSRNLVFSIREDAF